MRINFIFTALVLVISLSGCSSAKDAMGLTKSSPDEFRVVKRAPLELPESYALRAPAPGAPRPQEQAMVDEARQAVLGSAGRNGSDISSGDSTLLQKAGAGSIDPNIRRRVDIETANQVDEKRPVIKKLMNIGRDTEPAAKIVNPIEEARRLAKENQPTGYKNGIPDAVEQEENAK